MSDYIRRSPPDVSGLAKHKEWYHFCVFQPGLDLFINFSLSDGIQAGDGNSIESARVTAMALDANGWHGNLEQAEQPSFRGGVIDVDFECGAVTFCDGLYHVAVDLPDLGCELVFEPLTTPGFTDSIPIENGSSIKWVVVPRMSAEGWVRVGRQRHSIASAPAYHDHNWGQFGWGDNFSWEWAIILPSEIDNPWGLVYTRLSDRGRLNTYSEGLLVWRADQHYKTFRSDAIRVAPKGIRQKQSSFVLPTVMGLIKSGVCCDVPKNLNVLANSASDSLSVSIETRDYAHIVVPNDAVNLSSTVLTEVASTANVGGTIRGEPIEFTGPCVLELIHGE